MTVCAGGIWVPKGSKCHLKTKPHQLSFAFSTSALLTLSMLLLVDFFLYSFFYITIKRFDVLLVCSNIHENNY